MNIFIVAGEASGDLHAANLLLALQGMRPDLKAFGIGGERLRGVGLETLAMSEELSVMGLAEVLSELPRLFTLARRIRKQAIERRPDVAVLVDSPDFNLPLAKHLSRVGIPVVIYVSPQLWAWRSGRVRQIRKHVSRVLCILPFETDFYARHGVQAEYVGHPLVDELHDQMGGIAELRKGAVALLPGSRWHEVESLLPAMLTAVDGLRTAGMAIQARLIVAPGLDLDRVVRSCSGMTGELELVTTDRHRALAECSAALVASGTATLECALLDVPMVVGYRLHALTYALARRLVRVPHVGLVNLVAGERIAPELVQSDFTACRLAGELRRLLGEAGEEQRQGLARVRERLGGVGASLRAAQAVLAVAEGAR